MTPFAIGGYGADSLVEVSLSPDGFQARHDDIGAQTRLVIDGYKLTFSQPVLNLLGYICCM